MYNVNYSTKWKIKKNPETLFWEVIIKENTGQTHPRFGSKAAALQWVNDKFFRSIGL